MFHNKMKCYNENGLVHSQTKYGYNVMFPCYMSNRNMINYSCIQSFFRNICQNLYVKTSLKHQSNITNKNVSFERSLDLRLRFKTSLTAVREKCPNTDQKKLRIWTLFTQCWSCKNNNLHIMKK